MTSRRSESPLRVLLVEDQELDRMMVERAFRKSEIEVDLRSAKDGVEALELLRNADGAEPFAPPYLIVLDLNMPRMGGVEFLGHLRADPELRRSVVFVLTTSEHENDRVECYDLGVAGVVAKQSLGTQSQDLVRLLNDYWHLVELP